MLILNSTEVRQALPMAECIEAMKQAYAALSAGTAEVPLRMRLPVKPHEGFSVFMPAFVDEKDGQSLAVKIVSVFSKNPAKNLPLIHAAVVVMDPETGAMEAILEGGTLTAIRTGAGCGAATDLLARPYAKTAAIIGAGVQSRTQLEALCAVRKLETVWVYSPNSEHLKGFIADLSGKNGIPKDMRVAASAKEAVQDADIISAATTSSTPVFADVDVKAGAHINGAGSHSATMQEIPGETVARSRVTVDSRSASQVESGDIAIPLQNKTIKEADIAEIGEVVLGKAKGRSSADQITFFKSVGVAVQDAVASRVVLANARKLGLGTEVAW
jgi:ornithine cyclodeaminase/alanine dehydrogenase-like protein (mu-crystallin family)